MRKELFLLVVALLPSATWAQNGAGAAQGQQNGGAVQASSRASQQGRGNVQTGPAKSLSPEDAEIQRLKEERERLLKQKEIDKLRKENEQLESGEEKPPNAQAPPAKVLTPEDAELQRLEDERKRLLKEQEIEKLRKQNEALKTPPVPSAPPLMPPTPQPTCTVQGQGPKVGIKVPPKPSAWACKTFGICVDNKPIVLNADNGCPPAAAKGQPAK
jgi:hypothetical protein